MLERVLVIKTVSLPSPVLSAPFTSPPLRVTVSTPVPLVKEPMEELVPLIVRALVPSPRFTASVTMPPLIVTVSLPSVAVTEPIAPAPLSITKVLLVPLPRLRLPLREPPVLTVTPSMPVERVRFSKPLKARPSMVPLLLPLMTTVLSLVLSVMVSVVPEVPTRISKPVEVPFTAVALSAAVEPVLLVIAESVTETALP